MCVFCKILNGEIPGSKIYENEYCIAILDISQTTKGHTLLIPKNHSDNVLSTSENTLSLMLPLATKIALAIQKTTNAQGFNILTNCS